MSRRAAYFTAFSSYAQLASTTAASLISIPLALRYLDTERVGLWTITLQSLGYFLLVDFGLSNSVAKFMGPPVQRGEPRELSRWFSLLVALLAGQGLLAGLVGFGTVDAVLHLFRLPPALYGEARHLWLFMLTMTAAFFPVRIFAGLLFAQNRAYWTSVAGSSAAWVGLGTFWLLLHYGAGSMAYAYSMLANTLVNVGISLWALHIGPHRFRFSWSAIQWGDVRPLFALSGYVFLAAIAIQVIFATQELVITRTLGLAAVAAYTLSSKAGLLGMQLVWRGYDASGPRWLQSYLASDFQHLRGSYTKHFSLALGLVLAGTLVVMAANRLIVTHWARPDLYQGRWFDFALGFWMVALTLNHCLSQFHMLETPRMRALALLSLVDAGASITLGLVMVPVFGPIGMLMAAITASLITIVYNAYTCPRLLHLSVSELFRGLRPGVYVMAAVVPLISAAAAWLLPTAPGPLTWVGEAALALAALALLLIFFRADLASFAAPLVKRFAKTP